MIARPLAALAFCAAALAAAPCPAQTPSAVLAVKAEGTQFSVTLADGRTLLSRDLVGAILQVAMGDAVKRLRIDAVETDPGDPARGRPAAPDVFLHTLSVEAADGHWENICNPGPDGRRQAFPLAGRARADATVWPGQDDAFEITCTGGAQGKCVRFGYRPWEEAPAGAAPYDLYNSCVRMVRADYSGDGKGTTRNGMLIDLYDSFGIQRAERDDALEFEAGWTKDGAVCVRHPRVKENVSLDELDALPSLRGRTGEVCTEEFARAHGAVLFNRSKT